MSSIGLIQSQCQTVIMVLSLQSIEGGTTYVSFVVNFSKLLFFFCFVVAVCYLVHDVDTIFHLHLITAKII